MPSTSWISTLPRKTAQRNSSEVASQERRAHHNCFLLRLTDSYPKFVNWYVCAINSIEVGLSIDATQASSDLSFSSSSHFQKPKQRPNNLPSTIQNASYYVCPRSRIAPCLPLLKLLYTSIANLSHACWSQEMADKCWCWHKCHGRECCCTGKLVQEDVG